MKFNEAQLEQAFIELIQNEGYSYLKGEDIVREEGEVLIKEDLATFLKSKYQSEGITTNEIQQIVRQLQNYPSSDLYDSNKAIMKMMADGFLLKREDRNKKDLYIQLLDYSALGEHVIPDEDGLTTIVAEGEESYGSKTKNIFRIVNQLKIVQHHPEGRIPDGIIYINGLPLVVIEFKSAIRKDPNVYEAYDQLTNRYERDIPELFKYNAFCIISDGANNKAGSFFSAYDFFYAWRKITGEEEKSVDGISSLHSMIQGMLNKDRLTNIIRNFIYIPDSTERNEKIVCRYPQFYAANKLFESIKVHQKPLGDGKGGTYFGTTGCGKSYTMLFLARLLMKSVHFSNPTIIVITDRTDLDEQLSGQFTNAKGYIGDQNIISVESRAELRAKLQGIKSGGVFLTTIHKFTEDIELLTERTNVICISDEAHRSQINLDQKVKVTAKGVKKTYGFAKYLHDSLPNATYVGFTGTPVDATLDVFGGIVDAYTMTESVADEITVRIVYEGRAAKVVLKNSQLAKIEEYYEECAKEGSNEYQIEESKKASANMGVILGDPDRIKALAKDFVAHYENRVNEGSSVKGKAMFVSSSRTIAYEFYKELLKLRPEWGVEQAVNKDAELSEKEKRDLKPMEMVKMIMTRSKDDPKDLYKLLGTKEYRKELDRQFKFGNSNFKIAIVVDMWLTGFDVPFLDTIYIDKPIQTHNLIQTISRVNRKFSGKAKGLVVDYIGIKKHMNMAMAKYNKIDGENIEDIKQSFIVMKDQLDLLAKIFHKFDSSKYFNGSAVEQLNTLNLAVEFIQSSQQTEKRFVDIVKRLKAAYDICSGSEKVTQEHRDYTHFYLAVRSIIFKLTGGLAPDISQMNRKVREMIKEALASDGVEEILKLGEEENSEQDIFDEDYLNKVMKIKLPNTKIKLLQQLLAKAIGQLKVVNKVKGIDFSKKMESLVEKYNERKDDDVLRSEVLEDFTDEILDLYYAIKDENESFEDMGINIEEKAFYDILLALAIKYDFKYAEDKLIDLAKKVKATVDDKARYAEWNQREDIKAELKVDLIILLAENDYPPVDRDEVYQEIFEQAENFKKNR